MVCPTILPWLGLGLNLVEKVAETQFLHPTGLPWLLA